MTTTFTPGPTPNTVRAADGTVLTVPDGWILVPPGDAALTRRIKAAGDHYVVAEKKGRKVFSRGIWTAAATVERIRAELDAERSTEGFAKKKEANARRWEKAQAEYVEDFHGAVVAFLAFHSAHADLADRLARAVTDHATPVGSGIRNTCLTPWRSRRASAQNCRPSFVAGASCTRPVLEMGHKWLLGQAGYNDAIWLLEGLRRSIRDGLFGLKVNGNRGQSQQKQAEFNWLRLFFRRLRRIANGL